MSEKRHPSRAILKPSMTEEAAAQRLPAQAQQTGKNARQSPGSNGESRRIAVSLDVKKPSFSTLIDLLRFRRLKSPDRLVYRYLADGEEESGRVTFGELDRLACAIARRLQELGAPGQRALLLYPPGLEFIAAFLGCLRAGAVAVPAHPPQGRRTQPRLLSILKDCQPQVILTPSSREGKNRSWAEGAGGLEELKWLATSLSQPLPEASGRELGPDPDSLAFLQYTSGSTSQPKGVMISHGNLLDNQSLIQAAFRQSEESVLVSWLPPYHDMGLIGTLLQPLFSGGCAVLMPPLAFLQKPVRWLQAISRYRADTSGGPDFAYDLCVRRIDEGQRVGLDLSCWQVAFNGAEPVRQRTLQCFAQAFEPCGFRPRSFVPCYGLAEATLLVSGGSKPFPPRVLRVSAPALERNRVTEASGQGTPARTLVSSGRIAQGLEAMIVDPKKRTACPPGRVGEVWVSGPSVAKGYWKQPRSTRQTFQASLADGRGPYLRTADLGFLDQGDLFVAGRLKDLIIIRGRNHYPQDLEAVLERCAPADLRPGGGAAFSIEHEGQERLVAVAEVNRGWKGNTAALAQAARQAIAEEHQLQLYDLVLIRANALPKTTSGKVRRIECRRLYLEGALPILARSTLQAPVWDESVLGIDRDSLLSLCGEERRAGLESYLQDRLARILGADSGQIESRLPLTALGLDSLKALELKSELEETLGLTLPLTALLDGASLKGLQSQILKGLAEASPSPSRPFSPGPAEGPEKSCSSGQKALWFLQRLDPESAAYNLAAAAAIRSQLDVPALRRAFEALLDRHSALRSAFRSRSGQPRQRVCQRAEIDFAQVDASACSPGRLKSLIADEAFRPFDLEKAPLLRIRLFNPPLGADGQILLIAVHHIVSDFWSLAVLAQELAALYAGEKRAPGSGAARLGPPPLGQIDFVDREKQLLGSREGERLWAYWAERLCGELPTLDLPADRPRPMIRSLRAGTRTACLGPELADRLESLSQQRQVSLYVTLLSGYFALLHRWSGQQDLIVGSPTAGRLAPQMRPAVGYFANPVALRTQTNGEAAFKDLLQQVRRTVLGALDHQEFPFPLLVERLQPHRDPGRTPLFQTFFTLQAAPPATPPELAAFAVGSEGARLNLGGMELECVAIEPRFCRFDLSLTMAQASSGLLASFEYDRDLFDSCTIDRMLRSLAVLLEGIASEPGGRLAQLPMLSPPQRHQLIAEWNDSAANHPDSRCCHELFDRRAERTPEAVALGFEGEELSYGELKARSEGLACRLRASGAEPESLAGILLDPSPDLPLALLGVLKAGGAYLPLDPAYPSQRLAFMAKDSGLKVLLTQRHLADRLRLAGGTVICLDEWGAQVRRASGAQSACGQRAHACSLAYVIYTSGSTGRPKGVQISHGALSNFLSSMARKPGLAAQDVLLSVTTPSFDIAALEIFLPLIAGGRVIVAPREVAADGGRLAQALRLSRASLMQATPSTWKLLLEAAWIGGRKFRALCGGEAMSRDLANRLAACSESLWNLYGPTETTVWSALQQVKQDSEAAPVPIGRPIDNTRICILDRSLKPVPSGLPGEVGIGGAGLARGYLRRPALTAERFRPDPFSDQTGQRLYLTGDLARFLLCGAIECLGRSDNQVKVRGVRIELGEVEQALRQLPQVREAVVTAVPDASSEQSLAAYLVLNGAPPLVATIRQELRRRLPASMLPGSFAFLDRLPLTPNGKVDRKRLPSPFQERARLGGEFVAPGGPIEEAVAGIWAELLRLDRVGLQDDFFELGGHSLLAAQIVSRLREVLSVEVPLRLFFQSPTVAGLARSVEALRQSGRQDMLPRLAPVDREGPLPLSFGQQRLMLFDRLQPANPAYNMPVAIGFEGQLDFSALLQSLAEIQRRHEILRTVFRGASGGLTQRIEPNGPEQLAQVDLGGLFEPLRAKQAAKLAWREARRGFRLKRGPLLRMVLLRLSPQQNVLLLVAHHIVADAQSLQIFCRELCALYPAFSRSLPSLLQDLPFQYADYAAWQQSVFDEDRLSPALAYWRRQLDGLTPLDLPTDRPRPRVARFRGSIVTLKLPREIADSLAALCKRMGVTPFMALLAVQQALLSRWAGQQDVAVGVPVADRDRLEAEDLIGFFVNALVMRTSLAGAPSCFELLQRVRQITLEAYENREMPIEKLIECLQTQRSLSHDPLFQVTFAEQQEVPARELPGLALTPRPIANGTAKFDLSLTVTRSQGSWSAALEYDSELFDGTSAQRFLRQWQTLLAAASAHPERPVESISVTTEGEQQQILQEWNDTATQRPAGSCVHHMVEDQARLRGDGLAVAWQEGGLSYGELDRRANRMAGRLRRLGAGPEVLVGVVLERRPELMVSALATLKAGGAYIALDPGNPPKRVSCMLSTAQSPVLVTQKSLRERLRGFKGEVVLVEGEDGRARQPEEGNPQPAPAPQNLAYVIFTSGSTGQPKGVALTHAGLVNLILWHRSEYAVRPADRATHLAGLGFDASVWELWPYLAWGASVWLAPDELARAPQALPGWWRSRGISLSFLPTLLAEAVLAAPLPSDLPLRALLTGGDRLHRAPQQELPFSLINHYGPTEGTVVTTAGQVTSRQGAGSPTIGRPIDNTRVYVLDQGLRPVLVGAVGELCIAGVGLARAYLHLPKMTAERFRPNPFEDGTRLYRSGDLSRWLPEGELEFLGRLDHQVKIRGFRIEPGEVEAALGRHPAVREAAVAAVEVSGQQRIAAYVAADPGSSLDESELRAFLGQEVPHFMVPTLFVWLEALPLTASGKVDRRALPLPQCGQPQLAGHVAPRSSLEESLAELWADLLGVEQVGVHDDFFMLGGHSLQIVTMTSRIRDRLGVELSPQALFESPTIEGLAVSVAAALVEQADDSIAAEALAEVARL